MKIRKDTTYTSSRKSVIVYPIIFLGSTVILFMFSNDPYNSELISDMLRSIAYIVAIFGVLYLILIIFFHFKTMKMLKKGDIYDCHIVKIVSETQNSKNYRANNYNYAYVEYKDRKGKIATQKSQPLGIDINKIASNDCQIVIFKDKALLTNVKMKYK